MSLIDKKFEMSAQILADADDEVLQSAGMMALMRLETLKGRLKGSKGEKALTPLPAKTSQPPSVFPSFNFSTPLTNQTSKFLFGVPETLSTISVSAPLSSTNSSAFWGTTGPTTVNKTNTTNIQQSALLSDVTKSGKVVTATDKVKFGTQVVRAPDSSFNLDKLQQKDTPVSSELEIKFDKQLTLFDVNSSFDKPYKKDMLTNNTISSTAKESIFGKVQSDEVTSSRTSTPRAISSPGLLNVHQETKQKVASKLAIVPTTLTHTTSKLPVVPKTTTSKRLTISDQLHSFDYDHQKQFPTVGQMFNKFETHNHTWHLQYIQSYQPQTLYMDNRSLDFRCDSRSSSAGLGGCGCRQIRCGDRRCGCKKNGTSCHGGCACSSRGSWCLNR